MSAPDDESEVRVKITKKLCFVTSHHENVFHACVSRCAIQVAVKTVIRNLSAGRCEEDEDAATKPSRDSDHSLEASGPPLKKMALDTPVSSRKSKKKATATETPNSSRKVAVPKKKAGSVTPATTKGQKSGKSPGKTTAKEVESGPPTEPLEGGWPAGWIRRTFERQSGGTKGSTDKYWYSPMTNKKFRSMAEIKRFFVHLKACRGDEEAAWMVFKGK